MKSNAMRILFIHQNFPGQFRHAAAEWSKRPGWQVLAIGRDTAPGLPGVRLLRYKPHRSPHKTQHPYLRTMEDAVLHGQAVARVLERLRASGFTPDAIVAHPGWGETLYAKDIFPTTRLVHYCEWYYASEGQDFGFDPEFPVTLDDRLRIRTWNALHLLNLQNCDAGITPTQWQWGRHPEVYRSKITVAHEGIDTERLGPDPNATFTVPIGPNKGLTLRAGDPVITYVARNLEPYRGFHQFMRALQIVQREHKSCHTIIVGGDGVSYGRKPPEAANWREHMLREVSIDPARTHFVGKLPYEQYVRVLQVSAVHVYLTYPFVLSWSLLEAMACGCFVVASDTAPVREVVRNWVNGVRFNPLGPETVVRYLSDVLHGQAEVQATRRAAREFVRCSFSTSSGLSALEQATGKVGKADDARNESMTTTKDLMKAFEAWHRHDRNDALGTTFTE
jgi:glycosyltransferase involved in cell wall biosynthesis